MEETEENSRRQFDAWAKNFGGWFYFPFFLSSKRVLKLIKPRKGDAILDVGCGTGILLEQCFELDQEMKLSGLDISSEMVKISALRLPSADIREGSAQSIPFKDNSFDFVTCLNSFHHYYDSELALGEMFRVLKPGGTFVLLDPFSDGLIRQMINGLINIIFKEGETRIYGREIIKQMLCDAGFKNIEQKTQWYYRLLTIGRK